AAADDDSAPRPPGVSGPPTVPLPTPPPDETAFGPPGYELLERVGRSATGEIWKARSDAGALRYLKLLPGPATEPAALDGVLKRWRGVCPRGLGRADSLVLPNGRLAVVSAEGERPLADRLRECRREGRQGLPRAELLGHLDGVARCLDDLA